MQSNDSVIQSGLEADMQHGLAGGRAKIGLAGIPAGFVVCLSDSTALRVTIMQDAIIFAAQRPTCRNELSQSPRDPDEISGHYKGRLPELLCELCDFEWESSHRELANVECLLAEPSKR